MLHGLWRSACAQFVSWMVAGLGTPPAGVATSLPPAAAADPATMDVAYLLVLAGPSRGEVIPLGRNVTIGSGDEVDLHIPDETVSREHARIVRGTLALHLTDLQSAAGTRLNGLPVSRPTVLNDGDQISLGGTTLMLFTYQQGLEQQLRTGLFHRATHDPLTQAYTREYFGERLVPEVAFARRHKVPLAILLIQPRSVVEEAAPSASRDAALRKVARRIKSALRAEDLLARYDEDRLIIFCRNLNDQQALILARRLRQLVASPPSHVVGTRVGHSAGAETISIGISSFHPLPLRGVPRQLLVLCRDRALSRQPPRSWSDRSGRRDGPVMISRSGSIHSGPRALFTRAPRRPCRSRPLPFRLPPFGRGYPPKTRSSASGS